MDFAFFAIAFDLKKLIAKILKGGLERLFSYFSFVKNVLKRFCKCFCCFFSVFHTKKQKNAAHFKLECAAVFGGEGNARNVLLGHFDTPPKVFTQGSVRRNILSKQLET